MRLQLAPCQQLLSVIGTILWDFHDVGTTEPAGAEICRICYVLFTKGELQSKQVRCSWRNVGLHSKRWSKIKTTRAQHSSVGCQIWKCKIRSLDSDSGLWSNKNTNVLWCSRSKRCGRDPMSCVKQHIKGWIVWCSRWEVHRDNQELWILQSTAGRAK